MDWGNITVTSSMDWGNVTMTSSIDRGNVTMTSSMDHLIDEDDMHALYDNLYHSFQLVVSLIGIFFNIIVLDISRMVENDSSGAKWMQYLAIWDNAFLVQIAVTETYRLAYGSYMTQLALALCKLIPFGYWLSSITASAHLVALVVDRAIYMIFPDWHSRVKWSKVNMLISAGMVLFHVTILTPMLALYSIQDDGSCAMTSRFEIFLKVYQVVISTVFYSVTHFVLVVIASVVFVYKLGMQHNPDMSAGTENDVINDISVVANDSAEDLPKVTKTCAKNVAESIEMSGKVAMAKPNDDQVLTNFIYAGPGISISTEKKDTDVEHEVKAIVASQSDVEPSNVTSSCGAAEGVKAQGNDAIEFITATAEEHVEINYGQQTGQDTETPGNPETAKVVSSRFTEQDLRAIRTIQLMCMWYLFCNWSAVVLYLLGENVGEDVLSDQVKYVHKYTTKVLAVCNCSLNLILYLRDDAFSALFKKRWLSWV